jgi:hypothetical protein
MTSHMGAFSCSSNSLTAVSRDTIPTATARLDETTKRGGCGRRLSDASRSAWQMQSELRCCSRAAQETRLSTATPTMCAKEIGVEEGGDRCRRAFDQTSIPTVYNLVRRRSGFANGFASGNCSSAPCTLRILIAFTLHVVTAHQRRPSRFPCLSTNATLKPSVDKTG